MYVTGSGESIKILDKSSDLSHVKSELWHGLVNIYLRSISVPETLTQGQRALYARRTTYHRLLFVRIAHATMLA
jgi:hypothetical protein